MIFRSPLPRITNQKKKKKLQVQGILPQTWPIPKYLPIVESIRQSPIGLGFVETSIFCGDPSMWLTPSNLKLVVGCKVLQYTVASQKKKWLGYETLKFIRTQ